MQTGARSRYRWVLPAAVIFFAAAGLLFLLGALEYRRSGDVSLLRAAIIDRLALIPDVARYKWNTSMPVADAVREHQLIETLVARGKTIGLPDDVTRQVMQTQIAASRHVQEELIASWRLEGRGPFASVPELARETRPKIETATDRLLEAFARSWPDLQRCAEAARLRKAPPTGFVSDEVWTMAVEGLIRSAGGPPREACPAD